MSGRGFSRFAYAGGAIALLSGATHLAAEAHGFGIAALVAKPVPVLVFAAAVALGGRSALRLPVALGLLVSASGDVLIQRTGGFLPGLAAFLVAHLCYLAGFWRARREALWARAVPVALFGGTMAFVLAAGLASAGPALRTAVTIYMVAICTMIWRAAALLGAPGLPAAVGRLALAGAILFAASDSLIAIHRFVAPQPWANVPIMVLYWLGQAGIAGAATSAGGRTAR